jgi:hypothetical protein
LLMCCKVFHLVFLWTFPLAHCKFEPVLFYALSFYFFLPITRVVAWNWSMDSTNSLFPF